uniref:Spore germination protein GerPC n=1 Tax=Paenibacillus athensensis TaxID=1967502 RepID=A0A4Y8Q2M9_9BACL
MHMVTTWEMWFQQLYAFLGAQQRRIEQLEKQVGQLQGELAAVQKQKTIQIDRIEYKFDQLKVEKLEGTLSIGINPGALEDIADATVNGAPLAPGPGPGSETPVDTEEAVPEAGEEGIGPGTRMPPGMEGWYAPPRPGSAGAAGHGGSGAVASAQGHSGGSGAAASSAGTNGGSGAAAGSAGTNGGSAAAGSAGRNSGSGAAAGSAGPNGGSGAAAGTAHPWSELEREVKATISRYLQQEVRDDLLGFEARYHFPLDEGYRDMLVDDIRGQIDGRIRHYVQQQGGGGRDLAAQQWIVEKTKADIRTALDAYLAQLPIQKGDRP